MNFELLARQGRTKLHPGLAGINRNKLVQLRNESLRNCFSSFNETENRLDVFARIHDIEYINDSASETPNSTWFSLENMTKPTIWIACCGNDQTDPTSLIPLALEKVRILFCIGSENQNFKRIFEGIIPVIFQVESLSEAVKKASYFSQSNEAVLFSPACSTYKTANQWAEEFKKAVYEL